MTTHYIDLTVVPDPETGVAPLLGTLYDRLHQVLARCAMDSIGASFPEYSTHPRALGRVLRLHGLPEALAALMKEDWLKGMRDHLRMTEVAPAPAEAPHRTVRRRQFKTSAERLRRRRMRRKSETAEQAAQAIPATMERQPDLPYIHVRSRSTAQSFCLFIAMGPEQTAPVPGSFNSYGLGGPATVPWF